MALTKLIDSASFFKEDEPTISIVDFESSKGLLKIASDSRIQEYVSELSPNPKFVYLHILALGASEYWGSNKNADNFNENALLDYHKTFETTPAHIFRNHVNKNPEIAIGKVIFAIYNTRMHRVELISEIDKEKGADIVARIEAGDYPATSMACRTPFDKCSICGNEAHTRQEYCTHLRNELGKIYLDGRKVMALNVAPLKFFDMSIVVRPADVTSSVLQKVAGMEEPIIGSAEAAEIEGVLENGVTKSAAIQKLSEFIKEVDGQVVDHSDILDPILASVRDPDLKLIDSLVNFKIHEVLNTMAGLGISPSLSFLGELIGRKVLGDSGIGIGNLVQSVIHHMGSANVELPKDEPVAGEVLPHIVQLLSPCINSSSYFPEYTEKRASIIDNNNRGYIGMGPYIEPTDYERFRSQNFPATEEKAGLLKMLNTIMSVGGAAMAAKWYITRTIKQKMEEQRNYDNPGVKIILVKSASDYALTYKLVEAAMIKSLGNQTLNS